MPVLYVNLTGIILIYFKIRFFKTIVTKIIKIFLLPLVVSHFPVGLSFSKELELFPAIRNLQININLN